MESEEHKDEPKDPLNQPSKGSVKTVAKTASKIPSKNSSKTSKLTLIRHSRQSAGSESKFSVGAKASKNLSLASATGGGHRHTWRSTGRYGFKVPQFQNTFRLEPYMPFNYKVSDKILERVMVNSFKDIDYSADAADQCRNVAADMRDMLYKTDFDRVKYIVIVTVIEKADQSLVSKHGRLWDSERDTFSSYVYEAKTFWAHGMICAVYYE